MSAVCATPRQPLLIACAELPSTLSAARVPFEVPERDELADRLASVLEVIYLIFNEGYATTAGTTGSARS